MIDHPDIKFHQQLIASGKLPTEIYKYIKISDEFLNSINEQQLRFVSAYDFNDPFDSQINHQTKWTKESIKEYVERKSQIYNEDARKNALEMPLELFGDFFEKALAKAISKIGVSCFSSTSNNLLLWSHYANAHKGICLKFDITKDSNFFAWTLPMHYSETYPICDYVVNSKQLVTKRIITKSIHWKYESELRTLQKTAGNYKFNHLCLKEIIFGCKISEGEIAKVKSTLSSPLLTHLKFRQAKLHKFNFAIDIIDL